MHGVREPATSKGYPTKEQRKQHCPSACKGCLCKPTAWLDEPPTGTAFGTVAHYECEHEAHNVKSSYIDPNIKRLVALKLMVLGQTTEGKRDDHGQEHGGAACEH